MYKVFVFFSNDFRYKMIAKKPIIDVDFAQTGNSTFCCFGGSNMKEFKDIKPNNDTGDTKEKFKLLLTHKNKFRLKWLYDSFGLDYASQEDEKYRRAIHHVIKSICLYDRELSSDDTTKKAKKSLNMLAEHKSNSDLLIVNWFEMNGMISAEPVKETLTTSRFFFKGKAEEFIDYCHHKK